MANIDRAFSIDNWIALQDITGLQADAILIVQGSADPSTGGGFEAPIGSLYLRRDGSIYSKNSAPDTGWTLNGSVGSIAWGDITGILSNQTDLQAELDAKVDIAGDTMTGNLNIFPTAGNSTLTLKSPTVSSTAGIELQDSTTGVVYAEVFDETTGNVLIDSASGVDMLFNNATNGDVITLNNVSFQRSAGAGYTMPLADGTINQVIQTDGSGNLSFVSLPNATDELVKVSVDDTTADFLFSKLLGGTLITVVETNPGGNEAITINTSAEINTASNLGAGEGVFVSKVGSDLRFKSLVAGTNVSLSSTATEITINSTASGGDPDQNLWETVTADTGSTVANTTTDTLTVAGGTGITTSISGDTLTITNDEIGLADDLASVCVSRTTTFTLAASYADITWDSTDIETNPAVIEHNNTNTDNIDIKETGLYLICYSLSIDADPGEEIFDFRVRVNDTTVLPCSERTISEDDEINAVSCVFPANLTSGDFITLQTQASGGGNVFSLGHNFNVIRLRGTKGADGAAGPPGSGSSIIVKEEGVNVANTPHTELNFIGADITASDAGSGIADITVAAPIFGSEYQHAESLGVTTTTSTTFLNKVTLNTTSLPAGDYRIEVSYGWNHNSTQNDFEARVQEDAVNIGEIHKQEPKDSAGTFSTTGSSQRHLAHRVYYRTLTAGVRTYTLDFRTDTGGTNSSIWDAGITLWRVA